MDREAYSWDRRKDGGAEVVCTYDRSSGVAGVEPLKLWAKVALPPSCLVGFWMPPELIGPTPPKAQPDALFTGIAADISTTAIHNLQALVPYPAFHSVICSHQLFLHVVIAGLLQSHLASPSSIEELYLTNMTFVSCLFDHCRTQCDMTRQDAMQCADRSNLIPGPRTSQAAFPCSMGSRTRRESRLETATDQGASQARQCAYTARGQVSRDYPSMWGSFLTVSSAQQPRRIGTDTPGLVEAAEVVGHRGKGTDVEWVQRQFVVTVPVLFMVASSFLMSSQRLMWKQRLVWIAVCVYRRGICFGYRAVAGVGSVRFVGELIECS